MVKSYLHVASYQRGHERRVVRIRANGDQLPSAKSSVGSFPRLPCIVNPSLRYHLWWIGRVGQKSTRGLVQIRSKRQACTLIPPAPGEGLKTLQSWQVCGNPPSHPHHKITCQTYRRGLCFAVTVTFYDCRSGLSKHYLFTTEPLMCVTTCLGTCREQSR